MLWRKSLDVTNSSKSTTSDRICCIDISMKHNTLKSLVIVNVYFPSADHDQAEFVQCLEDLEELVCGFDCAEHALVIGGDFNAHLGTLAGPRGSGTPNQRGLLLKQFIDRNSLFVASHSQSSMGPDYTFHSGNHFTTIDYIITNPLAAEFLVGADCLAEHPLNVSDHLALTVSMSLTSHPNPRSEQNPKIDWKKSIETGKLSDYEAAIKDIVIPLLDATNDTVTKLDDEICHVSKSIILAADNEGKTREKE